MLHCIVSQMPISPVSPLTPIELRAPPTPATPLTPLTPLTAAAPITPLTPCPAAPISRSCSQQNLETDSGKSSCSPALLDCSFDSGICIDANDMQLQHKLKDYKRILLALERDREVYRLLRERLSKIVNKKSKKIEKEPEISCNVCCAENDTTNAKSFVQCSICNKTVCRDTKCSDWLPDSAQWECHACHSSKESLAHTSSWVAEQISFNQHKFVYPMRARSEIYIPISEHNDSSMHFESVSQVGASVSTAAINDAASTTISNEQKLKIREYVEEVVASMLGGTLDNVAVGQLSKSESYLPALLNGHPLHNHGSISQSNAHNNGSLTDLSQTRLRQLIETIIAETLRIPLGLSSSAVSEVAFNTNSNAGNALLLANGDARRHRTEHYFEPKIYQELLATAVLNKIADTHGNARHLPLSSPDFTATDANQNFKEHQSSSSGSSIEPRSDCSFTDTDQILNLSKGEDFSPCGSNPNLNANVMSKIQLDAGRESALSDYIAAHMVPLPDLSATATESEEDDYVSITSSQLGDGNWEDNWLFKKKKSNLQSNVTAGSIGMLVPAPKEDVRAQIGDKLADDISDLSEMGSDTDDSSLDLMRGQLDPLNHRLLNKHLIGGQNTKIVLDELIDRSSMISSTSPAENEPIFTETKNRHVVNATTKTEAINSTVTKSLLQHSPPSTDTMTEPCDGAIILPPPGHFVDTTSGAVISANDAASPMTGSIAEREYNKWNNAVDMPNNPYAPDALKRRISGSQEKFIDLPNISPITEQNPISLLEGATKDDIEDSAQSQERDYKRYSRDYYINDIKSPVTSSKHQTLSGSMNNSQDSTDITINEAEIAHITASNTPSEHIYQALPAQVVEDPASLETQSTLSNQSIQSVTTTASDDSDTIRIYDFKKQETTIIRDVNTPKLNAAATQSTSVESNRESQKPEVLERKERPTDLAITKSKSSDAVGAAAPFTPTRGSTPKAFKFLQPKLKLIDPSQVLSVDEDDVPSTPAERKPIEDEVAHALPSVKALAQAFLMTSRNCPQVQGTRRWPVKLKKFSSEPVKSSPPTVPAKLLDASPSFADLAEDATIASDLSSLETDPSIQQDTKESIDAADSTASGNTSLVPVRSGVLKSNIAFFENLKFK